MRLRLVPRDPSDRMAAAPWPARARIGQLLDTYRIAALECHPIDQRDRDASGQVRAFERC
jgi:hypothetical protein